MNEREWIKSLDRGERALDKPIDVASSVMRDLRTMRAPTRNEPTLAIAAWISAAAAAIVLTLTIQAWNSFNDPLTNLFASMTAVLQ